MTFENGHKRRSEIELRSFEDEDHTTCVCERISRSLQIALCSDFVYFFEKEYPKLFDRRLDP